MRWSISREHQLLVMELRFLGRSQGISDFKKISPFITRLLSNAWIGLILVVAQNL